MHVHMQVIVAQISDIFSWQADSEWVHATVINAVQHSV